jgi:GNAT superfamily N-acetyltransferase
MIVTANSQHLKDLVRLGQRYYEESPYRVTHQFDANHLMNFLRRAMISPVFEVAVAEWDGKTVGGAVAYISDYAWCNETRTNMELIYVDPEYRQYGLVEGLLDHQLAWSRRMQVKEMCAGDIGFRPKVVEEFYSRHGFENPGVLMRKVL